MEAIAAGVLIEVAKKVGAPIVKGLLEKYLGGTAGEIGGQIIDTIAEKAGVPPAELPDVPAKDLEAAVAETEAETPELLEQWNAQQRQAIDLMRAEMDKNAGAWTWAWRPFWMWLLAFLWAYAMVLRPLVNAAVGAAIEGIDLSVLMTLTGAYLALYMGGHTIKDVAGKWKGQGG